MFNFSWKETISAESEAVEKQLQKIKEYKPYIDDATEDGSYSTNEASVRIPYDSDPLHDHIEDAREKLVSDSLTYCIVIGIGGSYMGTRAIYDALAKEDGQHPELLFVDTVSPQLIENVVNIVKDNIDQPDEVLINVVSKSGTTTETLANFETVFNRLSDTFDGLKDRVIATTGHESPLWEKAREYDISTLAIPDKVGGRFSVFSPVGLFPLSVAGIDTRELLLGAKDVVEESKEEKYNPASVTAAVTYAHQQENVSIDNIFLFNPELESMGKWYRQLVGESLGKQYNKKGNEVHAGITPIVSVGTSDLHSTGQLYFGGPRDKFTTFVRVKYNNDIKVPDDQLFGLVGGIEGKPIAEIMEAIYQGVIRSYKQQNLPFVEVELKEKSAYEIGAFLQYKMLQIMYQGYLMDINAFNQPNVEGYKDEVRDILTSSNH